MNYKISIIVPVYKVENYLDKCVDSLIKQTYKNIEIILVNDGSPDKCPIICDEYSKKDKRIKVIHKKNGGLSDARNVGLQESTGEYIMFVDSDDYIETDSCSRFIDIIKNKYADIIVGNIKQINDENIDYINVTNTENNMKITGEQYLKLQLKAQTMHMMAWMNVYNRNFLINNNLQFKVGILHEDEEFTPRAFLKAKSVILSDITFYNYIIREGSITTEKDKKNNALDIIDTVKSLSAIYDNIEDEDLRVMLNDYLVMLYLNAFYIGKLYKYKKKYRDIKFLKNRAFTKKNKLKVKLLSYNGWLYCYVNSITKKYNLERNRK